MRRGIVTPFKRNYTWRLIELGATEPFYDMERPSPPMENTTICIEEHPPKGFRIVTVWRIAEVQHYELKNSNNLVPNLVHVFVTREDRRK